MKLRDFAEEAADALERRLQQALELVRSAFAKKVASMESQISELHRTLQEKEAKTKDSELLSAALESENKELKSENARLRLAFTQLQAENESLGRMCPTLPAPIAKSCCDTRTASDGKQFFGAVRERLCPTQLEEFVRTVKRFRGKGVAKEQTVEAARKIFGPENRDLFRSFCDLLPD